MEQYSVGVEVEDGSILLVLPRRMDHLIIPWQEAQHLGRLLEKTVLERCNPSVITEDKIARVRTDQSQVKMATYKEKYVAIFFEWTDRLKFCDEAMFLVARAMQEKAQTLQILEEKRVRLLKDGKGGIIPFWDWLGDRTVHRTR